MQDQKKIKKSSINQNICKVVITRNPNELNNEKEKISS